MSIHVYIFNTKIFSIKQYLSKENAEEFFLLFVLLLFGEGIFCNAV